MDHPRPGLRYIDAGDLDGSFNFDGLEVESYTEDKLGTVDGFIIDINSARPYYIVVDAGGWFTSKYFLLPIGHAGLDLPENKLIADVKREHVAKYPGFDRDRFEKLPAIELDRLDRQMASACCPEESVDSTADFARRYETWKHYQNATWWDSSFYRPDRADRNFAAMASTQATAPPSRSSHGEEHVVARADERAQPGDVIGIETRGEQTHIGDTSDDEDERRRSAEKAATRD